MTYESSWASLPRRFWAKVEIGDGCWQWLGAKTEEGYGHISVGRTVCLMAHRVAYELVVGPIPDGLQIDHLCRTPSCVRFDHLEPVTPAENVWRGIAPSAWNRVKEYCVRGHLLAGENVRIDAGGTRICRECRTIRQRAARAPLIGTGPGSGSFQLSKTRCPQGHPYDEANTYVSKRGSRLCRECSRQRTRAWRAAR